MNQILQEQYMLLTAESSLQTLGPFERWAQLGQKFLGGTQFFRPRLPSSSGDPPQTAQYDDDAQTPMCTTANQGQAFMTKNNQELFCPQTIHRLNT